MVDLRINETRQTGAVRMPHLLVYCLVGAVSNCAGSLHHGTYRGESVYLFLVFTIRKRATATVGAGSPRPRFAICTYFLHERLR